MNGKQIKDKLISGIKLAIRTGLIALNDGFICMPVKKHEIMFESFNGKDINDNPAAIYFEWIKQHPEYAKHAYFGVKAANYKELHKQYPNVQILRRFFPRWVWHVARADFWVFNSRFPKWWKKNKRTTYIQTWHGTPLKKLGVDIEHVSIPGISTQQYHDDFKKAASRWKYLIMPNQYSEDIFDRAFDFKNVPLQIGYPRNDVLYQQNNAKAISELKKRIVGNPRQKVILYAPTWRDDDYQKKGSYNFELPFSLKSFFDHVGDNTKLIIRPHYLIKDRIDIAGYEDRVQIEADCDISELYLISDLLITDYSSVMFDYANLKRPMLFYAYDLKHYQNELRGFYFDFKKDVPGPIVEDQDSFYNELSHFNEDGKFIGYDQKIEDFYNKFCSWEHGDASAKVVKVMEDKNE
ncbi:CDP-glycerol glycerophosphotransferase family protein [Fructilactobacillus fructivorans]|uniref:CDP-glycerol glycerophosphotransferase family protein n=1 Tax=Fructilactobacillus fructivorans TaxID=1614 RepID=UPI0006EEEB87|nr:CDP-glycerol glycerophosphotransferase family protein [Fructilactobacillus fructivorans]KRK58703.1 glycosyl glycerophosphate transferase [Fructilactobacillus fructivorans]KRN40257.1 glycosyl glycerophosphate transferase [Fructilactobacillus fructivorans]KRN43410.1 glycosyl glycerophosphate transferase [Fructilactobacillus fructivorans]